MIEIMTFSAVALTAFRNNYEGAIEGAFKYLTVGSLGSTAVLVGITILYNQLHTLNLAQISAMLAEKGNTPILMVAFGLLFIGFGTKAFIFPFHPLAADAHAVAPASISLMISGVLTKCGVYGIIRLVYALFQNIQVPAVQYLVVGFGTVSMFVCVTMAFNQHNFKRLLAFHSISRGLRHHRSGSGHCPGSQLRSVPRHEPHPVQGSAVPDRWRCPARHRQPGSG